MAKKYHRRRHSSRKMKLPGLKSTFRTVKNVGTKSVSGIFGIFKSGVGAAVNTAKYGIKKGKKMITTSSTKRRRSR